MGMPIDPQMMMILQQLMQQGGGGMAPGMSIFGPKSMPMPTPAPQMGMLEKAMPFLGMGSGILGGIGGMIEGNKQRKSEGRQRSMQQAGQNIQGAASGTRGLQELMQLLLMSSQRGGM